MGLPRDYQGQVCSLARTLEVVGERWTLLIVRDAFYGVRRFGDFVGHLGIPRAVLTERLNSLVAEGVLTRVPTSDRRDEYALTDKGTSLWPMVHAMVSWGDEHYAPGGPRRLFHHEADDALISDKGICTGCGTWVDAEHTIALPGPGLAPPSDSDDSVTEALRAPHRLLKPVREA